MNTIKRLNFKQHISILISLSLVLLPVNLQALPSGAQVVNGVVGISTTSNSMSITASNRAIINYDKFNINTNEIVKFIQPNSNSVVLNRVISSNPSSILGQLNANGNVFLVNPAGIYFGKNSVVNVNSLLATTLNISNEDFLNDNYNFEQMKDMAKSYIIQKGTISVSPNGFVVLASPFISNDGAIIAKTGHIVLGASDNFYIQFDPEGLVNYSYKGDVKDDKPIVMPKEYADGIIDNVINSGNDDLKLVQDGDKVELVGDSSVALVNGKLEAKDIDVKSGGYIGILDDSRLEANGGDITIFADEDAYSSKGASLIAKDGTVELSANKRVTYDGSYVDAKLFYMDPEELNISDNHDEFNGGKFIAVASKSIILDENTTIKTHNGDIEMDAPNITLKTNSKLLAGTGNIDLNATSVEDARIDIQDGVEITGGNIAITATSYRDSKFDSDSDNLALKTLSYAGSFLLDIPHTPIAYQDATTSSTISIGKATISGAAIDIASKATSEVSIYALFQTLALAYGKSHATSLLYVKNGATLTSTSDISLSSEADSTNHVLGMATNLFKSKIGIQRVEKENISVAYTDTRTDSSALVDSGATINAGGNFKLTSIVNKDISTSATGTSFSNGLLGMAVAYSTSTSENIANLSGNINAYNVEVASETHIEKIKTSSSAGVGNGFMYKFALEPPTAPKGFMNKLKTTILRKTPNPNPDSSVAQRSVSAAFSYSKHLNSAKATITDANVTAIGDINTTSNVSYGINGAFEENGDVTIFGNRGIKTSAIATIDSTDQNEKENSYSGAVAITDIANASKAYIGDGVALDTNDTGSIGVYSKIFLEYNIDWRNIENFSSIKDIVPKVEDDASFRGRLFTSYAQSNAQGTEDSYAGSFNDFKLADNSNAHIGKNVKINQKRNTLSKVSVIADNDVGALNFAGVVGWTYFGTKAEGTGAGGSYLNVVYTNNTNAYIDDDAQIRAGALRVSAIKNSKNLSISTAGGRAKNAISGSFSYLKIDDNTSAYVKGKDIVIGNSVNGKISPDEVNSTLKVNAEDNAEISSGTGGVVWGKNIGVGASAAINNISRNTQAYIDGSTIKTAESEYGGLDYIKAYNSGYINAFALSGTVATSTPSSDGAKKTLSGGGKYDLSISGDAAINLLTDQTKAYISNSTFSNGVENVKILAENSNDTRTYSGAGVFAFSKQSKGLAGSLATNVLNNSAIAYINNSDINGSNVDIMAKQNGEVVSMAGSGTISTGVAGLAGSVAINNMANETRSYVNSSTFNIYGDLNTTSLDDQSYKFFAGSLGVGKSFGMGLSFGMNKAGNTIVSDVNNSDIISGNIHINALQDYYIRGVSFSPAAGMDGMAVAASYGDNIIDNKINGYIGNTYASTNDISVIASDNSDIAINSGTLTGSTSGSFGVSASVNREENNITAYANYLKQKGSQNFNNVIIKADSNKSVNLISVGGSASTGSISAAGGVTINSIKDKVTSYVGNSSDFNASGSMQIAATEKNYISNYAGSLSGSDSVGIGGGISTNIVENEINAYIDGSTIEVRGETPLSVIKDNNPFQSDADNVNSNGKEDMYGLDILAYSNETIKSHVVNLAGGGSGGVDASISVNLVGDQLNAYSKSSYINYSWLAGGSNDNQEVRVRAISQSDVSSKIGAVSGGGSAAVGIATDTSIIKNTTNAVILGSYIKAKKMVKTISNSYDYLNPIVVSGTGAGAAGVAGSVSVAIVNNKNHAYNRGSDIDSRGNLAVVANDDTNLSGVFAGVLAAGGAAGVGASVAVTSVSQDTQAHIDDSNINASKDTSISANNRAGIRTYAANASVAGTAGVGGSVSVNTINSTAKAFTYSSTTGSMSINSNDEYKASSQNVYITSNNHSSIYSTPGALTVGGTAGVGVSVDVSTIHNISLAEVGSGTKISAQGNLLVQANSDKSITSKAISFGGGVIAGVSGSVLVANINAGMDGNGSIASADTEKTVTGETNSSMVGDHLGDFDIATQTKTELDKNTKVDVSYEFSKDVPKDTTYAIIGNNSTINVGQNTSVKTVDSTTVDMRAGVIVGGLVGVGGSVSVANIGMNTGAYIGKDVNLISGSLDVKSTMEFKNSSINSVVGDGGVVGLGAAVSVLNVDYENDAYIDEDSMIRSTAGGIYIDAISAITSNLIEANGMSAGLLAAGGLVNANYNQNGNTQAIVSENTSITSAGDFELKADYNADDLSAHTLATAAGAGVEQASIANISVEPKVVVSFGSDSNLTSGGFATFYTSASSSISSKAEGADVSIGKAGASVAHATWSPILTTAVGSNSNINAFSLKMYAFENTDSFGIDEISNLVKADAIASSGTLFGGGTGASSTSTSNSIINLEIGDSSTINTISNMNINAYAYSKAVAQTEGRSLGAFIGGGSIGNAANSSVVNLNIGQHATLNADRGININAHSDDQTSSNVFGGAASLISGTYVDSNAKARDNNVTVNIGQYAKLYSENGDIGINAIGYMDTYSKADFFLFSGISGSNSTATSASNHNININIDENSKLQARNINIKAYVSKLLSKADSIADLNGDGLKSTISANNFVSSYTNINIKSGASLIGEGSVNLESSQNSDPNYFKLTTSTYVDIAGGTGYVEADLNDHADSIQSNLNANKGSSITTNNLIVKTFAPVENDDIYVIDPVMYGPRLVAKDTEKDGSVYISSSLLTMDADIHQRAATPQELQIDKYGAIGTYGEISANIVGNDVVVNDLSNQGRGSVSLNSNGDLSGSSTIYLDNKYPNVTINNSSNKNLVINNIDVISDNANRSNISLNASNNNSYKYSYKIENPTYTMSINNYGTGDILLKGNINNHLNNGSIYNKYGNIYATNNQVFKTKNLAINAEHGALGDASNSINVIFQRDAADTIPFLIANSYYGTYLSLKGENFNGVLNNIISLSSIKAREDINLELDSVVKDYSDTSIDIMANYYVNDMEADGNIKIDQKHLYDKVVLKNGYMRSGIMDQTVTAGSNLIDAKYIASQDSDNIYLKDITKGGGRIDLNGDFEGRGLIETLSGFRDIKINNLSGKTINVGAVTTASNSDNGFYIKGVKKDYHYAIKTKTFGYDFGIININSNNGGKVQLTKELSADNGGFTNIVSNNGIYADSSALIRSAHTYLDTTNGGSIGSKLSPVHIQANFLNAKSADYIYINSISDITANALSAQKDINFLSSKSLTLAGNTVSNSGNIDLISANDMVINQITAANSVNLNSQGAIKSNDGVTNITANDATLYANGDITSINNNAVNLAVNNVTANSLNGVIKLYNSKDSAIGDLTAKNDIEFTSDKSLTLQGVTISKEGSVAFNSANDMVINQITAANSINLNSQGAIKSNDEAMNITANDATLYANGGVKMNTKVNILDATNSKSGDINIKNQGALRVDDLDGDGYSVYNDAGDVNLKTDSSFAQLNSKSIFANKDININANDEVFLSKIKSSNSVTIRSLQGNILGNAKVKPTITLEKDLALYAHNGVIGTVKNPITVNMKNGRVIVEAGKSINFLSTYISGINNPTGSYTSQGLSLFDNRIVGGTLLEYYYGVLFDNSVNIQNTDTNIGVPQNTASPKFKKSSASYIVGSL